MKLIARSSPGIRAPTSKRCEGQKGPRLIAVYRPHLNGHEPAVPSVSWLPTASWLPVAVGDGVEFVLDCHDRALFSSPSSEFSPIVALPGGVGPRDPCHRLGAAHQAVIERRNSLGKRLVGMANIPPTQKDAASSLGRFIPQAMRNLGEVSRRPAATLRSSHDTRQGTARESASGSS